MQSFVELVTSLKHVLFSRLTGSTPAKRCASTALSAVGGASLHETPPDPSNMPILMPRPPDIHAFPPPPPNFNYNRELVPYPEDTGSDTKELLKVRGVELPV